MQKIKGDAAIDRARSCTGKEAYGTPIPATRAAYYTSEWRGKPFQVYRCRWCGMYHIGNEKDRSRYDYSYDGAMLHGDIVEVYRAK